MSTNGTRSYGLLFRVAIGATALSLWAYIPYRYATRPPPFDGVVGTVYAVLFPLAAVLALAALLAAWRPRLVERLAGRGPGRAILGAYGVSWLAMGLMCIPSLQAMAAADPVRGAIATFHMTAQHVFLGLAAIGVAGWPLAVVSILEGRSVAGAGRESSRLGEPTSG